MGRLILSARALTRSDVEALFWKNIDKDGPVFPRHGHCWEWTRARVCGYGSFKAIGEFRAHRVSYRLFVGDIPDGLLVLHKCDNRLCVRPNHLFLGTQQDNMTDMMVKGRQANGDKHGTHVHPESVPRGNEHYSHLRPENLARGDQNGNARLTESDVLLIRQLHSKKYSHRKLGRMFGVEHCTIGCIVRRKTWRHV